MRGCLSRGGAGLRGARAPAEGWVDGTESHTPSVWEGRTEGLGGTSVRCEAGEGKGKGMGRE